MKDIDYNINNGCGAFRQVAFHQFLKACGVLKKCGISPN